MRTITPEGDVLHWERVNCGGDVAFPEVVRAGVAGGWLYAATDWDIRNDAPKGGWSITFAPHP